MEEAEQLEPDIARIGNAIRLLKQVFKADADKGIAGLLGTEKRPGVAAQIMKILDDLLGYVRHGSLSRRPLIFLCSKEPPGQLKGSHGQKKCAAVIWLHIPIKPGVCRNVVAAFKDRPGDEIGLGAAQSAPGVAKVSKDEKAKGVKSNSMQSQELATGHKGRRAPAVLDRWFDAQLGRLYSDVAAEPVPVEMLHLISKLKKPKLPGS